MQFRLSATGMAVSVALAGAALAAQPPGQTALRPEAGPPPPQAAVPQPFGMRLTPPPPAEQLLREKVARALKARTEAVQPKMLCVMPMIPVDPAFDAAIRRNPPQDTTFPIKKIQPPPCAKK
jgi:hypothetical protein